MVEWFFCSIEFFSWSKGRVAASFTGLGWLKELGAGRPGSFSTPLQAANLTWTSSEQGFQRECLQRQSLGGWARTYRALHPPFVTGHSSQRSHLGSMGASDRTSQWRGCQGLCGPLQPTTRLQRSLEGTQRKKNGGWM